MMWLICSIFNGLSEGGIWVTMTIGRRVLKGGLMQLR